MVHFPHRAPCTRCAAHPVHRVGRRFFVPYQTARFFEIRRLISAYRGSYSADQPHIVVCCNSTCQGVSKFLEEFFHPDHGVSNMHVVLLVPAEPSNTMRDVLLTYKKDEQLTYLKGDLLSPVDMIRARLDVATGATTSSTPRRCRSCSSGYTYYHIWQVASSSPTPRRQTRRRPMR